MKERRRATMLQPGRNMKASPSCADASRKMWLRASTMTIAVLSLAACGPAPELPRARLPVGGVVTALALSPDGDMLASGVAGRHATSVDIGLWNVTKQEQIGSLKGSAAGVGALAFSPDGETIYCGRFDGTIERWILRTRKLDGVMHDVAPVESLAIRPDGNTLFSIGGKESRVRVFDLRTHKQVDPLGAKTAVSMALSPDGKALAIGQSPLQVELVDLDTRRPIRNFVPQGDSWRTVDQVAFGRDRKLMVTANSAGLLEWWDWTTGRSLGAVNAHVSFARDAEHLLSMAFSPDSTWLATSGADGTIRVWNTQTHERTRMLAEKTLFDLWSSPEFRTWPCCLVFADGGRVLFSGHKDRMVRVWAISQSGLVEHRTGN